MSNAVPRLPSGVGMLGVLGLICAYFSWATWGSGALGPAAAADSLVAQLRGAAIEGGAVAIAGRGAGEDAFANAIEAAAAAENVKISVLRGDPREVRRGLEELATGAAPPRALLASGETAAWPLLRDIAAEIPAFAAVRLFAPSSSYGSAFLKPENLRNVLNQIVVIAITAVGMTLVIIAAGIDLSVGSLIALAAVVAAWLIERNGGTGAGVLVQLACSATAIAACGGVGLFSGLMITRFRIPPFIATLAMMQIASGLAYIIAKGQALYQIPDGYTWLGRGSAIALIPNAVLLMIAVYALGHVLMTRSVLGRYIFAVGGNAEAARLSGVPVQRVVVSVYVISGLTAGLGGVVLASQLRSGAPTYGTMYELYAIAAVVVGGTSLSGGDGNVLNTLIGALIIAVIQNGMNLTGVESYTQKIVLGAVILGAVLIDMLRRHGLRSLSGTA